MENKPTDTTNEKSGTSTGMPLESPKFDRTVKGSWGWCAERAYGTLQVREQERVYLIVVTKPGVTYFKDRCGRQRRHINGEKFWSELIRVMCDLHKSLVANYKRAYEENNVMEDENL